MTLTLTPTTFAKMLSGLIQSGCPFEAVEDAHGNIVVTFSGGY